MRVPGPLFVCSRSQSVDEESSAQIKLKTVGNAKLWTETCASSKLADGGSGNHIVILAVHPISVLSPQLSKLLIID